MLTVACVLKSGGAYTVEWVEKLQRGVRANLKAPHRFVCLSDVDVPCERVPLIHNWPGWWSKMEIYRLAGPVLFLDLDVLVTGSLDDLLAAETQPFDGRSYETPGAFVAVRDFYRPREFNTSVVAFQGRQDIYRRFAAKAEAVMAEFRGDQEWLSTVVPEAKLFPGYMVASYKKHCRSRLGVTIPPPSRASVVCFHGQPKMPDAKGWPAEMWFTPAAGASAA